MVENLYEILGVQPEASEAEIKSAYRHKAARMHPDHGGDVQEFKKLSQAHEILCDPTRRQHYDENGSEGARDFNIVASSVASLAAQAFAIEKCDDPIRWMQDQIDRQRDSHRSSREGALKAIDCLTKRLREFESQNAETENIEAFYVIKNSVEIKIKELRRRVDIEENEIEMGTKILEFMNGLSMNPKSKDPFNQMLFSSSQTTSAATRSHIYW